VPASTSMSASAPSLPSAVPSSSSRRSRRGTDLDGVDGCRRHDRIRESAHAVPRLDPVVGRNIVSLFAEPAEAARIDEFRRALIKGRDAQTHTMMLEDGRALTTWAQPSSKPEASSASPR